MNRFKSILISLFFISTHVLFGQTVIDRKVISSGGVESSSQSIQLSSTIGEPAVQTKITTNFMFTEGFQQPFYADSIAIFLSTTGASCIGRSNGLAVIDSIVGCDGPYQIIWSAGTSANDSNETFGLGPGDYTVQVVSNDGCQNIFPFTIGHILDEDCILSFFSGISPNNDGMNDVWKIENIEAFPQNKVVIYNRLGNTVFDESNYDNQQVVWGGQNLDGNELPSGTYFYVFETNGMVEKGWIELTR